MKRDTRIIVFGLWLGLAAVVPAYAELPPGLAQDSAKVSAATSAQRQILNNELETALRIGISEQDLSRLTSLAATRNYNASETAQFVQKLATLQRDALPLALVRDKLLEGMAKRVPAPAIVQVAANWSAVLEDAKTTLRELEQKGLNYAKPSERTALINASATLQQRYGAQQAFSSLAQAAQESGRIKRSAASIVAAAELTETLLLSGAKPDQALLLPSASLRANYSPQRIQGIQRTVLDQLRQGVAVADIINAQQKQFGGFSSQNPSGAPSGLPGGGIPGTGPGYQNGSMGSGTMPGSTPGSGGFGSGPGNNAPGGGPTGSPQNGGVPGGFGGGASQMPGGNFPSR